MQDRGRSWRRAIAQRSLQQRSSSLPQQGRAPDPAAVPPPAPADAPEERICPICYESRADVTALVHATELQGDVSNYVFYNFHSNCWLKFLAIFERLVLRCIEANVCK